MGGEIFFLRQAIETAGFVAWEFDIETDSLILANLQQPPNDFVSSLVRIATASWCGWVHPDDTERVLVELIAAIRDPGQTFNSVYRSIPFNNGIRWLHVQARMVPKDDGTGFRMVGLTKDLTAARETEAELRCLAATLEVRLKAEVGACKAAELRADRAARVQYAGPHIAEVAHDFNNVLHVVLGASTTIQSLAPDPERTIRLAGLITKAAELGSATANRLLAVDRTGHRPAEEVDVSTILNDLREILPVTLGAGITLNVDFEDEIPHVTAEKAEFETSLINLAANARDAMAQGGQLLIFARTETIGADSAVNSHGLAPGSYVRLSVSDTGSGMDGNTLRSAGKRFFTTKSTGGGLGLAMLKSFARRHGGGTHIESTPGEGTTVTIWFPACAVGHRCLPATAPIRLNEPPAKANDVPKPHRVLLVDDNEVVRNTVTRLFDLNGCEVVTASDGVEALGLLDAGLEVDALVCDLSALNGERIKIIQSVQKRRPALPAILLAANAADRLNLAIYRPPHDLYALPQKLLKATPLVDRTRELLPGRETVDC